ncbi:MAG: HAD-IA family hydrolase [Candidatus Thermoplasmatota archaeon]|nr:HAD-IA family hydrolase [Candidatus Thermoplasmatota archaeon]MCL5881776.1 HAD-IA family hydrolase [Candidatus Thermoplasmatota archaeon]
MIKAVLFDMDGTLLDSETLSERATNYGFMEILGREITAEEHSQLIGRPVKKILSQWFPDKGETIYDTGRLYFNSRLSTVETYPGISEVLEKLSKRYYLGVVTSSHRSDAQKLLTLSGLLTYIRLYVGQEDTEYQKPDPEPLNLALKRLNVSSQEAVYIGDQPYDVIAAHEAGIHAAAALWGSGNMERLEMYHPDRFLASPVEIFDFIAELR